jgi:hypothetical protein
MPRRSQEVKKNTGSVASAEPCRVNWGTLMDVERACPGAADRIVSVLEQEVIHQRTIEIKKVEAEIVQAKTRELFTHLTVLVLIAGGLALLSFRNPAGTIPLLTAVAKLVGPAAASKIWQAKTNQGSGAVSLVD